MTIRYLKLKLTVMRFILLVIYVVVFTLLSNMKTYGQSLNSGLLLDLPFSGVLDDLAHNSTLIVDGSVEFVHDRFGVPECALSFGPGRNRIYIEGSAYNLMENQGAFSICFWYKLADEDIAEDGDRQNFVQIESAAQNFSDIGLYDVQQVLASDTIPRYELWIGDRELPDTMDHSEKYEYFNDTTIWRHVALTVDSNRVPTLYLNRDIVVSDTNRLFRTGKDLSGYILGDNFYGALDDFRVYNRKLNEVEIDSLFNAESSCQHSGVMEIQDGSLNVFNYGKEIFMTGDGVTNYCIYSISGVKIAQGQFYDSTSFQLANGASGILIAALRNNHDVIRKTLFIHW